MIITVQSVWKAISTSIGLVAVGYLMGRCDEKALNKNKKKYGSSKARV